MMPASQTAAQIASQTAATDVLLDQIRFDWTTEEMLALFAQPFADLIFTAQAVHRRHHDPNRVQLSQLKSIKTGGCPEDCAYCPQSAKFREATGLKADKLMDVDAVVADARRAKAGGATRPGARPRIAIWTRCAGWLPRSRRWGWRPV